MTTMAYSGQLQVETCWCGIVHAVPVELVNEQTRQWNRGEKQQGIYCPLGHIWIRAGSSDVEQERARRESVERTLAAERAAHDQTKASLRGTKGALTRAKKRAAAGVCPCCTRTFQNVARHVASQHPEFARTIE